MLGKQNTRNHLSIHQKKKKHMGHGRELQKYAGQKTKDSWSNCYNLGRFDKDRGDEDDGHGRMDGDRSQARHEGNDDGAGGNTDDWSSFSFLAGGSTDDGSSFSFLARGNTDDGSSFSFLLCICISLLSPSPFSMHSFKRFTSESFTGFTRKSSAPSSKHLSSIQKQVLPVSKCYLQSHVQRMTTEGNYIEACDKKLLRPFFLF